MKTASHHSSFFLWLKKIPLVVFSSALALCTTHSYAASELISDTEQSFTRTEFIDLTSKSDTQKDIIYLAVAANFKSTLKQLVSAFILEHPNIKEEQLKIISGATGALYAQIMQGAPFDIFFSADINRPHLLIENKHAENGTYYSYAYGQLIIAFPAKEKKLCSNSISQPSELIEFLNHFQLQTKPTLAIANPTTAPYGLSANSLIDKAAEEFSKYRIVKGKNILHAQQLLLNSHADLAILSAAQANHTTMMDYDFCLIKQSLYTAIEQALVIIKQANRTKNQQYLIKQFFHFMKTEKAQTIILSNGYLIHE
jgi:molybdate transport system substrate-binding protein